MKISVFTTLLGSLITPLLLLLLLPLYPLPLCQCELSIDEFEVSEVSYVRVRACATIMSQIFLWLAGQIYLVVF